MSQTIALTLIPAATAVGVGPSGNLPKSSATFHAIVAGTGAVSATVLIQVSNDNTNWLEMGVITLSGTTTASDGFAVDAPWVYVRAELSAISGTGAAVTVTMGI